MIRDLKEWYLSAVKSSLILDSGMMEDEAIDLIARFRLKEKIESFPELTDHDDPRTTAREMQEYAKITTI